MPGASMTEVIHFSHVPGGAGGRSSGNAVQRSALAAHMAPLNSCGAGAGVRVNLGAAAAASGGVAVATAGTTDEACAALARRSPRRESAPAAPHASLAPVPSMPGTQQRFASLNGSALAHMHAMPGTPLAPMQSTPGMLHGTDSPSTSASALTAALLLHVKREREASPPTGPLALTPCFGV
ncbi:hypothetical protein FOA52_003006 [Chlamydomonas sp. UWO 241]|nr:hypothetical protein FOA52_003006 [Chlamydomonas sp. UWO 241]